MEKELLEKVIALRHELHMYPEPSNHETETKKRLMDFLRENTDLKLTDRGKWFYAEYHPREPKGSIAFRADMDALKIYETTDLPYRSVNKGVSHKCGHDGHSSALAGFAAQVARVGADKDVYFIFQHAEEIGEGGEPCSALIEEKHIDEVYAAHNVPGLEFGALATRKGIICCASKGMIIHFTGTYAHASSPEKGRNPAKAVSRLVLALDDISDPKKYRGLVLATVVQIDLGERAFGVSAHEGSLLLTIRGQHEDEMDKIQNKIGKFAEKAASEDGLTVDFSFEDEFPETCNDEEAVEKIKKIAEEKGWKLYEMEQPERGSEDFGYYLKKARGALVWIGAGEDRAPLHSGDFDFNDGLLERIAEFFMAVLKKPICRKAESRRMA